jgi:GNAT superfamily N-acetyltransferase
MGASLTIRPLLEADVLAASAIGWRALRHYLPESIDSATLEQNVARGRARVAHCRATDPAGAWVAEDEGTIVGVALAIVRESLWGLSLLAVDPARQSRGLGRRLLAAALTHDDDTNAGIIVSSSDPRAMRGYHLAGFRLIPTVEAAGALNAARIPAGLQSRPGDPEADAGLLDEASRRVRGASHRRDIPALIASGSRLLVHDSGGFAMQREGSPLLLAARDETIATDLLWSCFAAAGPGASVSVDSIAAGHEWAIDVALHAGLALTPAGPTFVRGDPGTMAPYLPSGTYL